MGLATEITQVRAYDHRNDAQDRFRFKGGETVPNQTNNPNQDAALLWLTAPGSAQAARLEDAMRNYALPVYDPVDVARRLMMALSMPAAGFGGDASQVDSIALAIAIIGHASEMGWDIVEEISRPV